MGEAVTTLTRADGLEMSCRSLGSGPPLVCLAGGPAADAAYLEDLGGLARRYRLIIPDARGTRGSPPPRDPSGYGFDHLADDVEALRCQLGLESMRILAHSAACITALVYTSRHPDLLSALVLIAPSRRLREDLTDDTDEIFRRRRGEPWYGTAAAAREVLGRGAGDADLPDLVAALAPAFYARWGEREKSHASAMAPPTWDAVGAFWAAQVDGAEVCRRLEAVVSPVLVITGDMDAATGVAAGAAWAKCFAHGRHVNIVGSGHNPWVDQPETFVEVIAGFLAEAR